MKNKIILPPHTQLISDYNKLQSFKKLAKKYKVTYSYINRYFIKNNLQFNKQKIVELTKEQLTKDYNDLQSIRKIGKKYNLSHETIRKYIHLHGIKYNKLVKYNCNHTLFSKDNEVSLYLAGFLAADGCVYKMKNSYYLRLGLALKDLNLLKKIKNLLDFEGPITYKNIIRNFPGTKVGTMCHTCEFQLTSKQISNDLKNKFNITPRKSLTYKFPKRLFNNPLIHHFIRGYFDGDGCVYYEFSKNKHKQIRFSLVGTKNLMKSFEKILRMKCKIHKSKPRRIKNIFELRYGGNPITSKIYDFLYKNATIFLDRKEDKFRYAKYATLISQTFHKTYPNTHLQPSS